MMTWDDVRAVLRELGATDQSEVAVSGGTPAIGAVRRGDRVDLLAPICFEAELAPRAAIIAAGELTAGGITIVDGCYAVRIVATLGRATPAELRAAVDYLRATATALRRALRGSARGAQACFAHAVA